MAVKEEVVIIPNEGFVRSETNPSALVNVDNEALKAYKMKREADKHKTNEINSLRNEVAELKQLLYKLLSEKNK
jgi:hypothetical protein